MVSQKSLTNEFSNKISKKLNIAMSEELSRFAETLLRELKVEPKLLIPASQNKTRNDNSSYNSTSLIDMLRKQTSYLENIHNLLTKRFSTNSIPLKAVKPKDQPLESKTLETKDETLALPTTTLFADSSKKTKISSNAEQQEPVSLLEKKADVQKVSLESFNEKALESLANTLLEILPKAIRLGLADGGELNKSPNKKEGSNGDAGGGGILTTAAGWLASKFRELKPAAEGAKPAVKGAKPAVEGAKPVAEGAKPAVESKPSVKPAAEGTKPAVEGTKPAVEGAKPAVEGAKPAVEGAKPAVESKPSVKPAAEGAKPAKPAVKGAKPAKPAVKGAKPAKPAAEGAKPAKPAVKGAKPLIEGVKKGPVKGKPRGGIGVGAIAGGVVGGKLAYDVAGKLVDKRDDVTHFDTDQLKELASKASEKKDTKVLKETAAQVALQKEDTKDTMIQHAAAGGGAIAGQLAGSAASKIVWKVFCNYVKKKYPELFLKLGVKLLAAAGLATLPIVGWLGVAINVVGGVMLAYDLLTLWMEFRALSDIERSMYNEEENKPSDVKGSDSNLPKVSVQDEEIKQIENQLKAFSSPDKKLNPEEEKKKDELTKRLQELQQEKAKTEKESSVSAAKQPSAQNNSLEKENYEAFLKLKETDPSLANAEYSPDIDWGLMAAPTPKLSFETNNESQQKTTSSNDSLSKQENTIKAEEVSPQENVSSAINVDSTLPKVNSKSQESTNAKDENLKKKISIEDINKRIKAIKDKKLPDASGTVKSNPNIEAETENIATENLTNEQVLQLKSKLVELIKLKKLAGSTNKDVSPSEKAPEIKTEEPQSHTPETPISSTDNVSKETLKQVGDAKAKPDGGLVVSHPKKGSLFQIDKDDGIVAAPVQSSKEQKNFSDKTSSPFSSKFESILEKIANNTGTTSQNIGNLINGFNNLAKALEKTVGTKVPVIINESSAKQQAPKPPSVASRVNSGNGNISNFRYNVVEASRPKPA